MTELKNIQGEIEKLKARNKIVESNKAWELSLSRKIILSILTYTVCTATLIAIKNQQPWSNAIIPTLGFFISTLTLPLIKKYWVRHIYNRN